MFDSQEPRSNIGRIVGTIAAAFAVLGGLTWYFIRL
jgi:hypothetical protein